MVSITVLIICCLVVGTGFGAMLYLLGYSNGCAATRKIYSKHLEELRQDLSANNDYILDTYRNEMMSEKNRYIDLSTTYENKLKEITNNGFEGN